MSADTGLQTADFDYHLPPELIAQYPVPGRVGSRMMVIGSDGTPQHRHFTDFPTFIQPGDCLVLNDSKVLPARIFGVKAGGTARAEALLLRQNDAGEWIALLRPGKRLKAGTTVKVDGTTETYQVTGRQDDGLFRLRFSTPHVEALLDQVGHMPLPPYIGRDDEAADREHYQTVYARVPGSVAAPTAGLHFTDDTLAKLAAQSVAVARVTLHVGLGTFRPVSTQTITQHEMHEELYEVSQETADLVNRTKANGGRVWAVGTTSVRTLESCADATGRITPGHGGTRLFMYPPQRPKVVDALLTNFHLPCSTLMMLVSCFRTRQQILAAYAEAVHQHYRFYSYGDCMLLPPT